MHSIKWLVVLLMMINISYQDKQKIKIYLIPHSHMDPGWIFTYDNYYTGANPYHHCVECIYNSVIESIENDENRYFIFAEMTYFSKFFYNQTEEIKSKIREFVRKERIQIVNGGWTMNDEAASNYQDIINNMRIGLLFIKNEFNITCNIGWSIDPFGHSATNAYLLSQLGYKYLTIVRIDYRDKNKRQNEQNLEFIWKPYYSIDNGNSSIITYINYEHYNVNSFIPESTISNSIQYNYFDIGSIQDSIKRINSYYKTGSFMCLYGDDFKFDKPNNNFINIERLIDDLSVNNNDTLEIDMRISTPNKYFERLNKYKDQFQILKNIDFFPYSDAPHYYWTGYFTSRPFLKGKVREGSNYLKTYSNILLFWQLSEKIILNKEYQNVFRVREEISNLQHHDGVSGTATQVTSKDYLERLNKTIENSHDDIKNFAFKRLFSDQNSNINKKNETYICTIGKDDGKCSEYLNITNSTTFLLFNPGVVSDSIPITLRFKNGVQILMRNEKNETTNLSFDFSCIEENKCEAFFYLNFEGKSSKIIIIEPANTSTLINYNSIEKDTVFELTPHNYLKFEVNSSIFSYFYNDKKPIKFRIEHNYYNNNKHPFTVSGAYIMSLDSDKINKFNLDKSKSKVFRGQFAWILDFSFENSQLRIKIFKHPNLFAMLEIESVLFPSEPRNLEFMMEITSNIFNMIEFNETLRTNFYTDTNGLKMMRRIQDYQPTFNFTVDEPIAGNFYPINSVISIREKKQLQFVDQENDYETLDFDDNSISLFNDRSQGATSVKQGQILVSLNRYSKVDDYRGLGGGNVLNEIESSSIFFKVKHLLMINNLKKRFIAHEILNKWPILMYTESTLLKEFHIENKMVKDIFLKIKDEYIGCLDVDVFLINQKEFILQVLNKFDFYFERRKYCYFDLQYLDRFSYNEVSLNTIDFIQETTFDGKLEKSFKLQNYEFKTFRITKK